MAVGIGMLAWAIGVGCSRMALHMHWWIDVVGGLALGATLASLGLLLSRAVVYLYGVKNEPSNTGIS
jgi:membrane-associated phospholipid phosphatase